MYLFKCSKARQISSNNDINNNKRNKNKIESNKEKPKRKNDNNLNNNNFSTKNQNNIINYNMPMNFQNYPIFYTPFASNNFPYMSLGLNNFQSFNNNIYTTDKYPIQNSIENTQKSSSNDKNYYDDFGQNYYESLQKGIKDISKLYNENKINKPKISLLCHYYCNIDRNEEDKEYMSNEIQKLGESLKKILNINTDEL